MRFNFIFIWSLLLALKTSGQDSYTISGKITNARTKEPLAFSTISIEGTSQGVISNFLGVFEFTFPDTYKDSTLFISMLGFSPQRIAITELKNNEKLNILLQEHVVMLEEVEVNERKLTARDIVNRIIENIPNNYPTTPYLLGGFTRFHKYECGKYIKLYEADFEVLGGGYHKKTPEKIYINESRQSKKVPYCHSRVLRANNNPFNSMGHINDVLFRSFSLDTKRNKYFIDKYLVNDEGDLIYLIKTNHSKYVTHTMYINAENYALIKVIMHMNTPEGENWNPHLNKGVSSDSLNFKVTRISKTIQFEEKERRHYAKYMDWLIAGELTYQESGDFFCDWGFRFETMFDRIVTNNVTKPSREKLVSFRSQKEPKSGAYDSSFWNNYPLIKDFPITPQIIEDLETNGSMEVQFKQSQKGL